MNEKEVKYLTLQKEDGNFLVASTETPRFCFECASEEEADEKAGRAFEAYFNNEFQPIKKTGEPDGRSKVLSKPRLVGVRSYTPKETAAA